MAVNPTLPANWIKEGMIVRCMAPVGLMRVRVVHDDGDISARRARSTKDDAFKMPSTAFNPATIEDRILYVLDEAKIGEIRKVIPDGKDERQYKIIFLDLPSPATTLIETLKELFEKVQSPQNAGNALIVTVPQSWLDELVVVDPVTPAIAARAEAEAEQVVAAAKKHTPVVADSAVVDWFVRMFTQHGIDMTGVLIAPAHRLGRAMGQDPTYALIWPNTQAFSAAIKSGLYNASKELRLRDYFANDVKILVDLPANWTPTFGEVTEAASVEPATVEDEDLTETARLIADLRERNERLQVQNENLRDQVDSLIGHIEAQELRAEDAAEAAEISTSIQPLTPCKEVESVRGISDAALEKCLNDGWEILHIQFGDNAALNVVFSRNKPAPAAPTTNHANARLIQKIGPQISYQMPQQHTPPVRFEEIANARATLTAMLHDPDVTHEDMYRVIQNSRLPKVEREDFIQQSRQIKVGAQISAANAQADLYIPSPFFNRPSIRIPAAERALEVNNA